MTDLRRENVRQFYDTFGWCKDAAGRYLDGAMADDWRSVTSWYRRACNKRMRRLIGRRGHLLLDAASGAVQLDDYIELSQGYVYHVCVDFSRRALVEARARLGKKALCVQADVTALPFRIDTFDAIVSLHTIYHIPPEEQASAFWELYRTLKGGRVGVIVYAQDRPLGYPLPTRIVRWLLAKERFARRLKPPTKPENPPGLYFHPLAVSEVRTILTRLNIPHSVKTWRSISVAFGQMLIPNNIVGNVFLRIVYFAETIFPYWFGVYGNYPLFRIVKPMELRSRQ